jgi:hypothetical protein
MVVENRHASLPLILRNSSRPLHNTTQHNTANNMEDDDLAAVFKTQSESLKQLLTFLD